MSKFLIIVGLVATGLYTDLYLPPCLDFVDPLQHASLGNLLTMHLFVWLTVKTRAVKRQQTNKQTGYSFLANSWQRMAQPMGLKAAQLGDVQSSKSPTSLRIQREGLTLKQTVTSKQEGSMQTRESAYVW